MYSVVNAANDAGDSHARRRVMGVLAGLAMAMLIAAVLIPALRPRQPADFPGVVAAALAASSVVAGVTIGAVSLAWFLLGMPTDWRLIAGSVFTSAWFIPLFIFAGQRSWLLFEILAATALQFACLGVLLSNTVPNETLANQQEPSPIPSFQILHGNIVARDALVASFFAQAGICAAITGRSLLAQILFMIAAIALLRRGWRMLREAPSPHPLPVNLLTFRALAVTPTLLAIFACLPHLMRSGTGEARAVGNSGNTNESKRGEQYGSANRQTSTVFERVFPGVVLFPAVKASVRLVAPPAQSVQGIPEMASKPYHIPFDGVYWFWRPPGDHPPESAVVKQGSPAKLIFRSTDGTPLWMEAHQNLVSDIPIECCSAIEVAIENADAHPDSIAVELLVSNTKLAGKPSESLGVLALTSSGGQRLKFKIPRRMKMRSFDELTIRFRMKFWRRSQSASIAIQGFALLPKA